MNKIIIPAVFHYPKAFNAAAKSMKIIPANSNVIPIFSDTGNSLKLEAKGSIGPCSDEPTPEMIIPTGNSTIGNSVPLS